MIIEQFDPRADTDSLRACYQIFLAAHDIDSPQTPAWSYRLFERSWVDGFGDDEVHECWLASIAPGDPVGCYLLMLPERENKTVAYTELVLDPERRRAGSGTTLFGHCAGRARAAGRTRLRAFVPDGTAGAAFAKAVGASEGIEQVLRTMPVDASLPDRLTTLRADAQPHAAGYEMESWALPSPSDRLDQLAELHQVMADAPRDAGIEPRAWDAERVRNMEQAIMATGTKYYTVVARHGASGQLVAVTQLAVDPQLPDWGIQQITTVRPEHRGHRLGLLVKIAMLDLLADREPAVRRILTGNAGENQHMIAINELLGYLTTQTLRNWGLDLAG
jgi:RimJ/RimL family protein N-acetyltransferase/GNAT superfamily N-acetyltransferase